MSTMSVPKKDLKKWLNGNMKYFIQLSQKTKTKNQINSNLVFQQEHFQLLSAGLRAVLY